VSTRLAEASPNLSKKDLLSLGQFNLLFGQLLDPCGSTVRGQFIEVQMAMLEDSVSQQNQD
jgi:hypothetical protein